MRKTASSKEESEKTACENGIKWGRWEKRKVWQKSEKNSKDGTQYMRKAANDNDKEQRKSVGWILNPVRLKIVTMYIIC